MVYVQVSEERKKVVKLRKALKLAEMKNLTVKKIEEGYLVIFPNGSRRNFTEDKLVEFVEQY
jgi:hypothetical protein